MADATVVFADLTGSTGVFESLGNAKATKAITRLTQWIGRVCTLQGGRVVKNLGDGVLMTFARNADAIATVVELQRQHRERTRDWPEAMKMALQIGMASGEIVEQDGDCFGDAVNLASRLSDLSGPEQILATSSVVAQLADNLRIRTRCLGEFEIRGRHELCVVHRIEWQSEVRTEFLTVPAAFTSSTSHRQPAALTHAIELSWLELRGAFTHSQLPMSVGRHSASHFLVEDPRVSRSHANIVSRGGKLYLEDTSSYGTWVRFVDSPSVVALRRQECVLTMSGEMALGAPFEDSTVPKIGFHLPDPSLFPPSFFRESSSLLPHR